MKKYCRLFSCFLLAMILLNGNHVMACSCCDNTGTISPASYVTATQYCEYLNDNASSEDPNGLYDERMGGTDKTPPMIIRSETPDGYTYSVALGQESSPIYFVSHKNQKMFLHWLSKKELSKRDENKDAKKGVVRMQCVCPIIFVCDCTWCTCRG